MQEYNFSYHFTHIPPIMRRGRHVLIVVKNNNKFVLGSKKIYPQGIYRFIGGGINQEEGTESGAVREVKEELQIDIKEEDLKPLAKFTSEISNKTEMVLFETYLYYLEVGDKKLTASDDLNSLVELTKEEVLDLVTRYQKLSDQLINLGEDKNEAFRWSDYGKYYSQIHKVAMELV